MVYVPRRPQHPSKRRWIHCRLLVFISMSHLSRFGARLAGPCSFVVLMQVLGSFREEDAKRKQEGEVCSLCGEGSKSFKLATIVYDGPCNGTEILAGQPFFELEGAVDKHFCPVSHITCRALRSV